MIAFHKFHKQTNYIMVFKDAYCGGKTNKKKGDYHKI